MASSPSPASDVYAAAELRLGRELTPGERLTDPARIDALLEAAKLTLADEIEKEKARAIRRWLAGEEPHLDVTRGMLRVLGQLYADGCVVAMDEIRAHGFDPVVPEPEGPVLFAASKRDTGARVRLMAARFLARVRAGLPRHLGGIRSRIIREGHALDLGEASHDAIARAMERAVPGSLNVAGQLISTSFYAGMGGIYEENKELFSEGWTYTAMMDATTCEVCAGFDGTHYESWDAAQEDLPDGGPNPLCFGEGRCRCRLVPEPVAQGKEEAPAFLV